MVEQHPGYSIKLPTKAGMQLKARFTHCESTAGSLIAPNSHCHMGIGRSVNTLLMTTPPSPFQLAYRTSHCELSAQT